ncbi:H-NS family nucleoid-associated regulatory protein [Delftia acidovorans]|uniref:H-NS histone family protein n=1 Tax=Delftia acidovorans TaxID=80866 RepID=UPI003C6D567D
MDIKIAETYQALKLNAIDAARHIVQQHALTPRDLFGPSWAQNPKHLYRNPQTGETWSGRGRAPRWIAGRDRTPFEI